MIALRLILLVLLLIACSIAQGKTYKLYYLGGQSNMDGFGYVQDLPASVAESVADVMIFHGNTAADGAPVDGRGVWAPLRPGHGVGFASDGETNTYSERFGVELTFAARLQGLDPDAPIALLKYSRGGTSIALGAAGDFGAWDPDFSGGEGAGAGVNQYDHFLASVRHALAVDDIDGDGEPDTLIPTGIVWMQGESDADHGAAIAALYEQSLKRLMDLIRAAFRVDDLPVVIGRISDSGQDDNGQVWDHGDLVRTAQARFVVADAAAGLVTSTDEYGYSDKWHYDSAGYVDLGQQFANEIFKLQK